MSGDIPEIAYAKEVYAACATVGLNVNAGLGVLDLHYRGMERQRYR